MNYDDPFTQNFEEKFQKNLKAIREIPPEAHQILKDNIEIVADFLGKFKNKPDKTPEDLEMIANLSVKMNRIMRQIEDMQLILSESIYRQSRAFYENVKKLAKEGDKEAEKIYNELKIYVEKYDAN